MPLENANRWITSSRIGDVDAIEDIKSAVTAIDSALAAYSSAADVVGAVAEAEAFARAFFESLSVRSIGNLVLSESLSEIVGAYLSDGAHLLLHTNLNRLIDLYGVTPFLDDATLQEELTTDPVATEFPLPYGVRWFATQAERLGSSTLRGLEQPPLESGFAGWQETVVDAFYDLGDTQRPLYGPEEEVGALLVTGQATDLTSLMEVYGALQELFSRKPAEFVTPQVGQLFKDLTASVLPSLGSAANMEYLRPELVQYSWSTSPDFVRVSSRDLIPLIGDILLDLDLFGKQLAEPYPTSSALAAFAEALQAYVDAGATLIEAALASINTLVSLLSLEGASRLWIPVAPGGSDRIVQVIQEAESTRRDLQRVVLPSNSGYARNELITFELAEQARATDVGFVSVPAENQLVAGAVMVFNKGPVATLLEELLAPKEEDVNENDDPENNPAARNLVLPDPPRLLGLRDPLDVRSRRQAEENEPVVRVGPENPTDRERTGWVQGAVRSGRPVGASADTGALTPLCPTPGTTSFAVRASTALQTVPPNTARGTLVRRGEETVPSVYFSSESRPARLVAQQAEHSAPNEYISPLLPSVPWAGVGSRMPIGDLPGSAEGNASRLLPMSSYQKAWETYLVDPQGFDDITVNPGGTTFSSAQFEAALAGLGYSGGILRPKDWWLDVTVAWARYAPAETLTRTAVVRVRIDRIDDSSGSAVFTTEPALPCYPVISSSSGLSGVFWAGESLAFRRVVTSGAARDAFVRGGAPGITFESVCGWRRSLATPDEGLLLTLQSECMGVLVDSDTAQAGRKRQVWLLRDTDRPVPGLALSADKPLLDSEPVHSDVPLVGSYLHSVETPPTNDTFTLTPALAARDAFVRAEKPDDFTYYLFDPSLASQTSSEKYMSERLPKACGDTRVLTAHAPRSVLVGLGTVSSGSVGVPAAAQSTAQAILVLDVATGQWTEVPDAADAAALAAGNVLPRPGFVSTYSGTPWAVSLEWGDSSDLAATLIPAARQAASTGQRYQGHDLSAPAQGDEVLTTHGSPISARFGAVVSGEAAMSSSGRVGASSSWAGLASLVGTSRLPKAEQGRELSLTFTCLGPWAGRNGVWTLVESASHVLTLVSGDVCTLRAYERDLLTERLVLRAEASVPFPIPGRRYQAAMQVDPDSTSVSVVWRQADSDDSASPAYADVVSASVTVTSSDPYPYTRALDGYPLTGATIRLGRPFPPAMTVARSASAYVDQIETYHAGVSTTENWSLGSLPLAFISVTSDALTP